VLVSYSRLSAYTARCLSTTRLPDRFLAQTRTSFGERPFLITCSYVVRRRPHFVAVRSGQDVEAEGAAEGYAGEFIVPLPQTLHPPLSTIVSAWLEQRPGRTVQLIIGESWAVAQSTEQAESFLWQARQLRSSLCENGFASSAAGTDQTVATRDRHSYSPADQAASQIGAHECTGLMVAARTANPSAGVCKIPIAFDVEPQHDVAQ
jgi:hypothetical protein